MRQYLLGGLGSDEMDRVEELLLTDDSFYDELVAVEDELIDRYVGNSLSDQDRTKFESHFLTTLERRRQVSFARGLKKYVAERPTPTAIIPDPPSPGSTRASWFTHLVANRATMAFLAMLLVVVSAGIWLTTRNWRANHLGSGRTVVLTLSPRTTLRGGGGAGESDQVTISSDVRILELDLQLPSAPADESYKAPAYESYKAVIQSPAGHDIFSSPSISPNLSESPGAVVVKVPANDVPVGESIVDLRGITPQGSEQVVQDYVFSVVR